MQCLIVLKNNLVFLMYLMSDNKIHILNIFLQNTIKYCIFSLAPSILNHIVLVNFHIVERIKDFLLGKEILYYFNNEYRNRSNRYKSKTFKILSGKCRSA